MTENAGSDWSQRPRPVMTAVNHEGQVVDQVAGLFTAAHLVVAVVYDPPTIPLHRERQLQPRHEVVAFTVPFTSSLYPGAFVPIPTLPLVSIRTRSTLAIRKFMGTEFSVPMNAPSMGEVNTESPLIS